MFVRAFDMRGRTPTLPELQAAQAIGRFEGIYGAWGPGGASNNFGAIQCGHYAPCAEGCFEHGDSHADGTDYVGCFRVYATPEDGAADLVRELYRRPGVPEAMRAGDAQAIATAMHDSQYFEADPQDYGSAIERFSEMVAEGVGEPWVVKKGGGAVSPGGTSNGGGLGLLIGLGAAAALWTISKPAALGAAALGALAGEASAAPKPDEEAA